MSNVFDTLKERGFIYDTTDEKLPEILSKPISFYIGYDPSASSLHVGNLLTIMAAVHMQRAGHRPVVIVGGATGMVGDPSGKTEMRQMLTAEDIDNNIESIKEQLSRYIEFGDDKAIILNNADWLGGIGYIEFLREAGAHFSVNRMLTSESVKQRLENGLSFLEFNYSLLQAYDFYVLMRDHDVILQMGGQDQWGNIVAGIDFSRRKLSRQGYGFTFPLITDAKGAKFGKSVDGAIWLDADRKSPYDYYQFWRNVEDGEVGKLLSSFTYLPMDEVDRLAALESPQINRAKEILAFEATMITHGQEEAVKAYTASVDQFGSADPEGAIATSSILTSIKAVKADIPTVTLPQKELEEGYWVVQLFADAGLAKTNGEARRLIKQGGCYLQEERVASMELNVDPSMLTDGELVLRVGKKKYRKVLFA